MIPYSVPIFSTTSHTSRFNPPVQNVNSYHSLESALTHPYSFIFLSLEGLNQNPPQFTRDYTTQFNHAPQSRPFPTKQPILHIKPTHLIPTKRNSDQSSSFKSPHSSISMCLVNVSPTFSRGTGIGRLHPVYISSWFMIRIYLPPNNFQFAVTSSS